MNPDQKKIVTGIVLGFGALGAVWLALVLSGKKAKA